jgi:hypothetical protein
MRRRPAQSGRVFNIKFNFNFDFKLKVTMNRLLILIFCFTACSNADQRDEVARASPEAAAAACKQFTQEGLKLKATNRAELEAEAGRPSITDVTVEPNRHMPGQQDSIIRLEYNGMEVQLRKPGPGGEMFEYVAVTDRRWLNFPYFRPGVSVNSVIAAMGEPQRRENNRLIYNCGESEADAPVVFEFEDDAVKRIVFNYYVD